MPPEARDVIEASSFSPDTADFLRLLHEHGVRYLVVGGEAVIFYGHARLTGDVDVFYDLEGDNPQRLWEALLEFWEGNVPGLEGAAELAEEGLILQFGLPPNRIDLINTIDAVRFADAWPRRTVVEVKSDEGSFPINYLGLQELIRNKEAAARPKDLEDLEFLRSVSASGHRADRPD
jgi:hypothetical protein